MKPAVLFIPPTRLLVTGRQDTRKRKYAPARRPEGTADWILIYNDGGSACFRSAGREFTAREGDVVLIHPGTPHEYGRQPDDYWKNIWCHFHPRVDSFDWLKWPEIAPGLMCMHLKPSAREQVCEALRQMDIAARSAGRRHDELAVNALERALLLCDSCNPRHAESRWSEPVRKATHLICEHLQDQFTVASLASQCGLSRSHFVELFRKQVGMPPTKFLEERRLSRARELLEHTSKNLTEIAGECGFGSPFYLSLRFKKHFGTNPRDFRKQERSG